MCSVMYKRPIIRPKKPVESLVSSPCAPNPGTVLNFTVPPPFERKPPVPIWKPKESYPEQVKAPIVFHQHVYDVVQKFSPHRPPLKALVDAMRLDGFSEERIKKTRAFYAEMRRTVDKRQAELDKLFGKYSSKQTKPVKKVLKVLKKV